MAPNKLGAGDILLAECYLTRYRCDEHGKPVYDYATAWTRWRTGFELKYLTLLRTGEETAAVEPLPPVDDSSTARM